MSKRKKKKLFKRIKNDIAYHAIRLIIGFFRLLPRGFALALASTLGRIASYVAVTDYRLAVKHLTIAFGNEKTEAEIRWLARETFRMVALNFMDAARFKVMSTEEILRISVPHNIERLRDHLAKGKGVITLTSHTGCWEIMGQYLPIIGIPTAAIGAKLYDSRLEDLLMDTRTRRGVKTIARGENTRDIIRLLRGGYLMGVLIDQDTKVKGEFVDFFGSPAHTATAPALLSLKLKAPIIPLFTYRDKDHRQHICVGEQVQIDISGDMEKDVLELTKRCSEITEQFIREHPDQWVWFHRRWKTKPEA